MENKLSKKKKEQQSITIESNFFPKNGYPVAETRLDPIARVLLMGVYDDDNPLSIFRGMRYIIKEIWNLTIQFNKHHYALFISTVNRYDPLSGPNEWLSYDNESVAASIPFTQIQKVERPEFCNHAPENEYFDYSSLKFPKPLKQEMNINMMPIKMDTDTFKHQIPKKLHGYIPWINACLHADSTQQNKICYLTIHESFVEKGKTQRRPGLHIELPQFNVYGKLEHQYYGWGGGHYHRDGLFIASNIDNSCAVWNCRIVDRENKHAMDRLGGVEHLRSILPESYLLEKDTLYWITDRTPHEALPMKKDGWRQFFRFVSSKLSVWYQDHSSPNPIGVVPDKQITKIIKGNKFKQK